MENIDKLNKSIERILSRDVYDGSSLIALYVKSESFLNSLVSAYQIKGEISELPSEIVQLANNLTSLKHALSELENQKRGASL